MRKEMSLLFIVAAIATSIWVLGYGEFALNSGLAIFMIMILWALFLIFYFAGYLIGYGRCEKRKAEIMAQTVMGYERRIMNQRFGKQPAQTPPVDWAGNLGRALRRDDDLEDNFEFEDGPAEVKPPPKDWIN